MNEGVINNGEMSVGSSGEGIEFGIKKSTKNLGVGGFALLSLGFLIPVIGGILALIGNIMHLIFYYRVSKEVGDRRIFRYMVYSLIVLTLSMVSFIGAAIYFFTSLNISLQNGVSSLQSLEGNTLNQIQIISSPLVLGLIGLTFLLFLLGGIFFVVAAKRLAEVTGRSLIFVGAILLIIPLLNLIGAILYFIGLLEIPSRQD